MTVFSKTVPDTQYVELRNIFMTALTANEFHAVEFYTSSGYKEINQLMLNQEIIESRKTKESYQEIIDNIHAAVGRKTLTAELPILYRGTRQQFVSDYVEGQEISFPFFLSTSTDPVIAARFAGKEEPAVLVIKGVKQDYAVTSLTTNEKEIVLSPLSRFTVDRITPGVAFRAEYDSTGFYAPEQKNVTVIELTVL